jgi:hypothetical protein
MSEEIEKIKEALSVLKKERIRTYSFLDTATTIVIDYAEDHLKDDILFEEHDKKTDAQIKADLAAQGITEESMIESRRKMALAISPELKLALEEIRAVIGDLKEALAKDQFDNAWLDTLSLDSRINKLL